MHRCGIRARSWGSAALLLMMAAAACGQQNAEAKGTSGNSSTHASPDSSASSNSSPSPDFPDSPDPSVYAAELQKSDIPWSGSPSPYNAEVELADGRRVAMHYRQGKGLVEQHYSPRAKAWTEPALIYRTKADACQGIELVAKHGTVAAIADFGPYCYDGEPPAESIAAVGIDSLRQWDTHVTKDFDGWERASISHDGRQVTFQRDITLHWNKTKGFDRR